MADGTGASLLAASTALALLYLEEAGLPLPVAPGEMLLIGLGLLAATGSLNLLVLFLAASPVVMAGAVSAFLWTRWLGRARLRSIAGRLHLAAQFDRAGARIQHADARGVAVSRLIPGLRIYTSMVAGVTGLSLRTFALGALVAVLPWVAFYLLLGFFVGVPAKHLFGQAVQLGTRGATLAVLLLVVYLALRHLRPTTPRMRVRTARWRVAAALVVDVVTVAVIAGLLELVSNVVFGFSGGPRLLQESTIFLLFALGYVVVTRRALGMTGGEALLEVRLWRDAVS